MRLKALFLLVMTVALTLLVPTGCASRDKDHDSHDEKGHSQSDGHKH